MTGEVPPWVPIERSTCAVWSCTHPRWVDPRSGHPRRWCAVHTALREREIKVAGGGSVIYMEGC